MSMEPHERFRRELESSAMVMRVILARRHSSARWAVLGLAAVGLLSAVVAIFLLVTGSDGAPPAPPPPTAPSGSAAAPTTTRRDDPPPAPGTAPGTAPTSAPPPSRPPIVYTVQRGDTLARIALRWQAPMEWIAADNGIADLNRIIPGQRLLVRPAPAGIEVIPPGATLTDAARRHGVRVTDLLALNPRITDPNRIVAGALLRVGPTEQRRRR
jgi:hypothetical protein